MDESKNVERPAVINIFNEIISNIVSPSSPMNSDGLKINRKEEGA